MTQTLVPVSREAAVQHDVKAAYEKFGCFVANFSQGYRPRGGTRQTPGIPDLYVFPPLREEQRQAGHPAVYLAPWWHETKSAVGKQSLEQIEWQRRCAQRGVAYVLGGVADAIAHLRRIGLVA